MTNNKRPRTLPWGTPLITCPFEDNFPLTFTSWKRSSQQWVFDTITIQLFQKSFVRHGVEGFCKIKIDAVNHFSNCHTFTAFIDKIKKLSYRRSFVVEAMLERRWDSLIFVSLMLVDWCDICAVFQSPGRHPFVIDIFMMFALGLHTKSTNSFSNLGWIPSGPSNLFLSRFFISFRTSASVIVIWSIILLHLGWKYGRSPSGSLSWGKTRFLNFLPLPVDCSETPWRCLAVFIYLLYTKYTKLF